MPNESARTFALLERTLGIREESGPNSAAQFWARTREQMLQVTKAGQGIVYSQDWISDFWIARGSQIKTGFLAPDWDPPLFIDDWPGDGKATVVATNFTSRPANYGALSKALRQAQGEPADYDPGALSTFYESEGRIQQQGDDPMVFGEHVRAWLSTALGHLLKAIVLTPWDGSSKLGEAAFARLQFPLQIELPPSWANSFEERRLELLYNLTLNAEGRLLKPDLRLGQGEGWREHWGWLSHEITAQSALGAVQLAARLMRSPALLLALAQALAVENSYMQLVSLAVVRRWLLTLKAMTWLEMALAHSWEVTRPQDLCCFAFNATKPEWPRRTLGISHRSADVKPTLIGMKLWHSSRCAIDANYAPSWETNTGMMWGLFAALPVIARVESSHYRDSVWCRRELEVTDYLLESCDFRAYRWLLDVPESELPGLDSVFNAWTQDEEGPNPTVLFDSFPPLCMVWSPQPMSDWELKILRAAGALRVMNVYLTDPELTNKTADVLFSGVPISLKAPTNNADGWQVYAAIFADLRSIVPGETTQLPIHLPIPYSLEDRAIDLELANRILDLSTGVYDLRDTLVAFEWLRTEWPVLLDERRGDFLLLNCQRLTEELWRTAPELSLHRGLMGMRTSGPLWLLQLAGQTVENWPLVGERPIFTEHVAKQFLWMQEIFIDRRDAQRHYPTDSGLSLAPELVQLCMQGKAQEQ